MTYREFRVYRVGSYILDLIPCLCLRAHEDLCMTVSLSPLADGTCAGVRCHPDATCDQDQPLGPVCLCKAGYQGNGRKCSGKVL